MGQKGCEYCVSKVHFNKQVNLQNPIKKREHPTGPEGNDGPARKRSRLETAAN